MDNSCRAYNASYALQVYVSHKGEEFDLEERPDQIVDLITDLLHYADRDFSLDPEQLLKTALLHFQEEMGK